MLWVTKGLIVVVVLVISRATCFFITSPFYKAKGTSSFSRSRDTSVYKSMVTEKKYRSSAVRNAKKANQMLLKRLARRPESVSIMEATATCSSPPSSVSSGHSTTSSLTSSPTDSDSSTAFKKFDHELMCRRVRLPRKDETFWKGSVTVGPEPGSTTRRQVVVPMLFV